MRPYIRRIVGLTATPASNGLLDLWAEVTLIDKGERFGRYIGRYRESYFRPASMDPRTGIVYSYELLPGAEEKIYERISDIAVSMKATDHLKMPELITNCYEVEMSEQEEKTYSELKKDLVLDLPEGEITAANAAVLTGKLLQLSGGAIYTDDGETVVIHDRKLDALEDIVESMNGKPLLVVYWFRHDIERIEERLSVMGVRFSRLDSNESITRWNEGKIQVALANPQSTAHGLNLQESCNTICWYSPIWSLELYQQMNGRIFRQGQKEKTVVITHIITKGTVDERVMKALEHKDRIQDALLEAVKAELI